MAKPTNEQPNSLRKIEKEKEHIHDFGPRVMTDTNEAREVKRREREERSLYICTIFSVIKD